jgi:hypothetical protein
MDERDLEPEQAGTRTFIDEIRPGARELYQRCVEIAHLVGNVVHSGSPLRKEAADRRVFAKRLEQLDSTVADADRRSFDTLLLHRRAVFDPSAEQPFVGRERGVEVLDRDPQVMDPSRLHASDAIR